MRNEFLEYAFLTDQERDAVSLPSLDADAGEFNMFWNIVKDIKEARGEQPEEAIHSFPGAMRGDAPLSYLEKEAK